MLDIYKKLFDELNKRKVKYFIYKSLNHLEEDLSGERGDIDIISENLREFNKFFLRVLKSDYPKYFLGLDNSLKLAVIDLDSKIRLGHKPYRPHYFRVNIQELHLKQEGNVIILDEIDYIPLMFLMRVTSSSPKKVDLEELKRLLDTKIDFDNSYIVSVVETLTNERWENIIEDIKSSSSWKELQRKYKTIILKNSNIDYRKYLLSKIDFFVKLYKVINRKIFKTPPYRVRKKGFLIAFIGNDGAGKSSTIEFIEGLDYFKLTGTKKIYFGNNHYMIPGLNYLVRKAYSNRIAKVIIGLLEHIDKQYIRSLVAYFYIKRGYIVLADRYMYDELMGQFYSSKPTSILRKIYKFLFKPRMLIKPKITFFLDVDPEVAFSRKQDYEFEIVKQNIRRYREFLSKFKEVVKVNANKSQDEVRKEVIEKIYELDLNENKKYFNIN